MARERLIYVIAGEPSGDAIGEKLITAIRNQYGSGVEFVGLGGPAMESVGFQSRFPISELSVMGLVESCLISGEFSAVKPRTTSCDRTRTLW